MTTLPELGDDLQLPSPAARQVSFHVGPPSPLRFEDSFLIPDSPWPLLTQVTAKPLPVPEVRRPSLARRRRAVFRPFTSFDALELTVKELVKQLRDAERRPRRATHESTVFTVEMKEALKGLFE